MLVSHRKQFIYTKTKKTASTSVEVYFEPFCLPPGAPPPREHRGVSITPVGMVGYRGAKRPGRWQSHTSAQTIAEAVGPEIWARYFKFSVIRNPYEKMLSAYTYYVSEAAQLSLLERTHYRLRRLTGRRPIHNPVAWVFWANQGSLSERFSTWLRLGGLHDHKLYRSGNELLIDYFIRYETLAQGMAEVCGRVGVPWRPETMPRLNLTTRDRRMALAEIYSSESRSWVERNYAWELAHFGYRFEG